MRSERARLRHATGREGIGPDVLRHRIIVSYEAEAEAVTSETIVERIFAGLPVP